MIHNLYPANQDLIIIIVIIIVIMIVLLLLHIFVIVLLLLLLMIVDIVFAGVMLRDWYIYEYFNPLCNYVCPLPNF